MPLILPPGTKVTDASNNPVSGGKVRVYDQNTTNLSSLYSDEGLTVALSNPVTCNSAGLPTSNGTDECLIYAASGVYDVTFLDASNVTLEEYPDAPTFGEESAEIDRTVTGGARVKITGSAGAVLMQVGDPSPDDTGGLLTIEGWAGTQGDALTLDFASTNTSGALTVGGKKLPGVVYTAETTATGANIDIALPEDPANVRAWRIDLWDIAISGAFGEALQARFSFDNGATYKSGASDYAYGTMSVLSGALSGLTDDAATGIVLSAAVHSYTNKNGWVTLEIVTPENGSAPTLLKGDVMFFNFASATEHGVRSTAMGGCIGGYGRATHVRIYTASGYTLTCKYRVQPLYGFGEA